MDGFTCPPADLFSYFGSKIGGPGWLQVDLKKYYTLKSVRIPVKADTTFPGLEYRFGNETKEDNYELNQVLITNSEDFYLGQILEIYSDVPIVGRYFLIKQKPNINMHITEIQIIAEQVRYSHVNLGRTFKPKLRCFNVFYMGEKTLE